jgi:hypothetical protein
LLLTEECPCTFQAFLWFRRQTERPRSKTAETDSCEAMRKYSALARAVVQTYVTVFLSTCSEHKYRSSYYKKRSI